MCIRDRNDSQDQNAVGESSEEVSVAQEESEYKTYVQSSVIVPFQGASEASFVKYKDGIVCARTNYICYINDSGEKEWEYYVSITDPVVKAAVSYTHLDVYKRQVSPFKLRRRKMAVL